LLRFNACCFFSKATSSGAFSSSLTTGHQKTTSRAGDFSTLTILIIPNHTHEKPLRLSVSESNSLLKLALLGLASTLR
ncbi:hypothetical protein T11_5398, partial [Trichinella zimbabwensis]